MAAHPRPPQPKPASMSQAVSPPVPSLWIQLEPRLRRHLAQHWARLVQQMLQTAPQQKEVEDVQV
jgi:hypothetical protein